MGIVPGVNIVLAMLGVAGVIPMTWFGLAFGLFVIGSFGLIKPVSNLQRVYDKKLRILSIYAELISLIENREMNAPLLRHLKAEFGMNGKSTTHILKELSRNWTNWTCATTNCYMSCWKVPCSGNSGR